MEESLLDPVVIPRLEQSVRRQVERNEYDGKANRGLLKLYQLYPDRINEEILIHVLAKALMALPEADFALCLYLIPVRVMVLPRVSILVELERKLQAGEFQAFWEMAREDDVREVLTPIRGFMDAVRSFILDTVSRTFQSIEVEHLQAILNVDSVDDVIAGRGWSIEGSVVRIPLTRHNEPRPKTFQENVKYEELAGVIAELLR